MQFSRNWLAEYVDWGAGGAPAAPELAQRLTDAGHAVERVEPAGDDVLLDVDVTTNRPDCMNHLGLARELAVLYGRPLRWPSLPPEPPAVPAQGGVVTVAIDDPKLCRRFVALVVRGVTIGPSPEWLVKRLAAVGVRSINNVVDVTNFVLWEQGQPVHAYDMTRLAGPELRVRAARAGEVLVTLDGERRQLDPSMAVIADSERVVGLAGVMGGEDSEVSPQTRDLIIECACFDPSAVRRTAGRLGMHTDASHRFERGSDIEACARAARRVAALICELAGGEVRDGIVDLYPRPYEPRTIPLDHARLVAFAGADIPAADAETWLRGLGCELQPLAGAAGTAWAVAVPSWRAHDLELTADLYEEMVRIYGFDRIEAALPALSGHDGHTTASHRRATAVRRHLAACGYVETIHFAFHDAASDQTFPGLLPDQPPLLLANPLSERYAVMRRSLLPNLVQTARFNQRRGASEVRLFEVGHVFTAGPGPQPEPEEREALAIVAGGDVGSPWEGGRRLDFFDLKGVVESLAEAHGATLELRLARLPFLVEGCSAELLLNGRRVGYCGQLEEAELPFPVFAAELATGALPERRELQAVQVPSRFPAVRVDLTLTHARELPWAGIRQALRELAPADLAGYRLLDRYTGKGVPEGAVNTTIQFVYNSAEGSLTQEAVNERQQQLAAELVRRFGWQG